MFENIKVPSLETTTGDLSKTPTKKEKEPNVRKKFNLFIKQAMSKPACIKKNG